MNKWSKGIVSWNRGKTLYLSVPFTWLIPKAEELARKHPGRAVAGGPAVDLIGMTNAETPGTCYVKDVVKLHNPDATFTTRGCPNRCGFCIVPAIEGRFRQLPKWRPAPIVCDNNLLASTKPHFRKVIQGMRRFERTDFNQGLDARRFTSWHAGEIAKLKNPIVRFAFDFIGMESYVKDAIDTARAAGLKDIRVYVLIGYRDTPAGARERLEKVREWKLLPNPMRYQPLDAMKKNSFVGPGWTDEELKKMTRYYSRLKWVSPIPYDEFIWDAHRVSPERRTDTKERV